MKNSKKSAKKTRWIWLVLAIILVVVAAIFLIGALTGRYFTSGAQVKLDEEFSLKAGEQVVLVDANNTILKLESIEDGRCPDDDNIVCSWEGQLYYHFSYEGANVTVGSVLEDDTKRPIGSIFTLDFVSGDENSGTFILRKVAE